jgi:hypothetical protein
MIEMKDILKRIENLNKQLSWEEESCEESRKSLIERASKCTSEQIAHGWLDSEINAIGCHVEKIQSIRDQIRLLETIKEAS